MTAKVLRIESASRFPVETEEDELEFRAGVNLIVGDLNVGKTKWIQMLDYALGDRDPPEKAFNKELSDKYDSISLKISVGDESHQIERRWKQKGATRKIFVDGSGISPEEFSEFMLTGLNIPVVERPSGDPYDRDWVELSWRELFRHMYKWELPWAGFVEQQPEVTRSACILHFLQAQQQQFLTQFEKQVKAQKKLSRLIAQRDAFDDVVQELVADTFRRPEMKVAVTPGAIEDVRARLLRDINDLDARRRAVLAEHDKSSIEVNPAYDAVRHRLADLSREREALEREQDEMTKRRLELEEYARTLQSEVSRLGRGKISAALLADLRVTHCPACDQEIKSKQADSSCCYVCGQDTKGVDHALQRSARRADFEEKQIGSELAELEELLGHLTQSIIEVRGRIRDVEVTISAESALIQRSRELSERALPVDLAVLDRERGRIDSELQQLERVAQTLERRKALDQSIGLLEEEIAKLKSQAALARATVNFQELSTQLSDGMNDYLNALNIDNFAAWKFGRVNVHLTDRDMKVQLGGEDWMLKAGGSVQYIVQLAYHYALLSMTGRDGHNYPGFLMVDFPPQLAMAKDLGASENYLLSPFVDLCSKERMKGAQVIVAGRAFRDLKGANMIYLGGKSG